MAGSAAILIVEAIVVYVLVLWTHSVRHRFGLGAFYSLLGGLTVIMSWVTDAGARLEVGGLTFVIGSTVFYTAILLGVFVVYVFDGPAPTRKAILIVAGLSVLTPLVATTLHVQMASLGSEILQAIPTPSFRINTASVLTTTADLVFLAMAWEFMGRPTLRVKMWWRTLLTLLGVLYLDVFLFSTGAFAGTGEYLGIMGGTFLSRTVVAAVASPVLYAYMSWQNRISAEPVENRPVLAIFMEVAETRAQLDTARSEIERRQKAEAELKAHKERLEELVSERTAELTRTNAELHEANEAKRLFLANMSHELRTPLNSIIGFSGILASGKAGEMTEEQVKQVEMVNSSGRYLLSLVDDVLDLSRVEAGEAVVLVAPFLPSQVATEVIEMMRPLAHNKGLELRFDPEMLPPRELHTDKEKVKHILLNLVGNSIKFTDAGYVALHMNWGSRDEMTFAVEDTGQGISRADQQRLFEAFTQVDVVGEVKPKGTGLGLALSRVYARMLEGDITVESELGIGSTFTLRVPDKV